MIPRRFSLQFLVGQALAVALLITGAPEAQGQGRPDSAAARLDSLVVQVRRTPTAIGGSSALVVRPAALAYPAAPALPLADLLRQVPFVLIRQNARGENEISIRGSDSRQAAVLVDGIPITLGWDSRIDPSLVPLTGVRQLTVTRGLSSVLGGPNVLGGMVEFGFAGPWSRSAVERRDLAVTTGVDGHGGYGLTVAGGSRTRTGAGGLTVRGGVSQRARDGVALGPGGGGAAAGGPDPGQNGEGRLRTNSDLHEIDAFGAVRLEGATGRHIGLTITGFEADRGVPAELHLTSPRYWRYPRVSRRLVVASAGTGPTTTPLGVGSVALSTGLSTGQVEIATFADGSYATVTGREYGDERTTTARALATHSLFSRGALRASYTWSEIRYDERFDAAPASRYRQRLGSAGLEADWLPGNGSAQLTAGIVHDWAETPESGGRESLARLSRTGWRLGASTLAAASTVRLHAALSRRSRFPALRELYSGSLDRFDPNPALRPERLLGAELGGTLVGGALAEAGFTIQAVAFQHRLDDAVVRVTLPDGRFRRINRDEIRSNGLELIADWSSARNSAADGGRAVTLTADLLVQRVRVRDQGLAGDLPSERRAEHMPELRASLHLGVPVVMGIRAAGALRVTGSQYCQHPELGQMVQLGGQAAGDLALTREWVAESRRWGNLRALLAVDNISDAAVYDQCGLPQPGRMVRVGVELR